MKFNDMPYERIDIENTRGEIDALISAFSSAGDFEKADSVFKEAEKLSSRIETMFSLAQVRYEINTEDEFYQAEIEFIDKNTPHLEEKMQEWAAACVKSAFRPEFESKYGSLFFKNIEMRLKTFSPEIIPELQEENRLTTEYTRLLASAQIPFEGSVYTISQLAPFKQDVCDERRRAAWSAEGQFYNENLSRLDELYDSLCSLRSGMAKKLGFKSFIELGYCRMSRNCYGAGDVEKFREATVKYIVPLACEIYKEQAKRIGRPYPLSYADISLAFKGGNPKPQGTAEDTLNQGRRMFTELSPETAEFIEFLYDNELLDVLSRKGKAGGGFSTTFPDYGAPFIFANFNGSFDDVSVLTHEAGHAFASFTCRDIFPSENRQPTLEACEVHSMSMECFSWPWDEGFFGEDTEKFHFKELSGMLTFIPYGCMVDHFQHLVYENPGMKPEERHAAWKSLYETYMPWVKFDGIPCFGEGRAWQRQLHIYQAPFYYIDYCLAQSVALQFWALLQDDLKAAFERYLSLVKLGGTKTFTELVEAAGLLNPFGDEALKTVSEAAVKWLNAADKSKF